MSRRPRNWVSKEEHDRRIEKVLKHDFNPKETLLYKIKKYFKEIWTEP